MGLLQNISIKNAEPVDRTGDTSEFWPSQLAWQMNKYVGWASLDNKTGVPEGYSPPYSIQMPVRDGGMSTFTSIVGSGTIASTSSVTAGKSWPISTITGSGTVGDASLSLIIQLLADITGSGEVSNSTALKAIANFIATITGQGEIADSPLNLIAWCNTTMAGNSAITATMKGFADMSAEISATGDVLTAQQVASAVWAAIAADNNIPTTMGEKLNDAGGASNPWSVELPGSYTGDQAGKLIDDIKKKTNMIPGLY
jgi:hypothetical protein